MSEVATRSLPPVPHQEWMSALPPAMRFILQGDVSARSAAASVWGVAFAEQSCRAVMRGGRATLWLGPDEYLLLGGLDGQVAALESQAAEAAGAFELALADIPHALVNVSHRQFALEVSGPHAATILSGGCPLDLDLSEFPVGMCTRTVVAKADIVLWRTREDAFHVEVWRSFTGYVTGLLREIAVEFYGP
ncbi:MAG: sarcosine oxidase subunit gamma [Pseudomonadota bacterium]|nr:sarcosine oxidase subunit gamma [Pseudomonadota bacterium]